MNATNHPCASPHEHSEPGTESKQIELADFRFWRMYVYIHLAIMLVAAIGQLSDTYGTCLMEEPNQWGIYAMFAALSGLLFIWALPVVLIVLLYCSWYGSARYFFIALAEILISGAYMLALLPAVS